MNQALPTVFTLPNVDDLNKMRHEYKAEKIGIVYFLDVEEAEVIKIGYASDLKQRIGALQTGNHKQISEYFFIHTVPHAEQIFHNLLNAYRVKLEWFNHEDEVEQLIECLQDIELAHLHESGDGEFIFTPEHIMQAVYDWSNSYGRNVFGGGQQ